MPTLPNAGSSSGALRDRVVALHRIPADELQANPRNWRGHPAKQRKALARLLGTLGFAGAALAYRDATGRLTLIDGHLRRELADRRPIPVLELDVTPAEADALLATFDPVGALATATMDVQARVLADVTRNFDLADVLETLSPAAVLGQQPPAEVGPADGGLAGLKRELAPTPEPRQPSPKPGLEADDRAMRVLQVYLEPDQYDDLLARLRILGERYGSESLADTVIRLVLDASLE